MLTGLDSRDRVWQNEALNTWTFGRKTTKPLESEEDYYLDQRPPTTRTWTSFRLQQLWYQSLEKKKYYLYLFDYKCEKFCLKKDQILSGLQRPVDARDVFQNKSLCRTSFGREERLHLQSCRLKWNWSVVQHTVGGLWIPAAAHVQFLLMLFKVAASQMTGREKADTSLKRLKQGIVGKKKIDSPIGTED